MDAILIQSPNSKLEATGSIPFSITRGVLTEQPMTIDITSAGIDLAVLEAANTGLVNAAGLLVVDVHVTGTGSNPVASGSVRGAAGRVHAWRPPAPSTPTPASTRRSKARRCR